MTREHLRAVHEADQRNAALRDVRARAADGMTPSERAIADSPFASSKPVLLSTRYRCAIGAEQYDVLACGKGGSREIRVCDMRDRVVWFAPYAGPLTSRAALCAFAVFCKTRPNGPKEG